MTLYIIVLRKGLLMGLLVLKDPIIWPYDWDTWAYYFAEP